MSMYTRIKLFFSPDVAGILPSRSAPTDRP